jgi:hypothetical protein
MKHLKLIAIMIAIAMSSSLFGAIIMYDGFDGRLGASITNVTGGTGWADATWSVRHAWNTALDSSGSQVVEGLSYSDGPNQLITSGKAILIQPVDTGGNEGYQIQRASTHALITSGTTWESFLIQPQLGSLTNGRNDAGIFTSTTQADNAAFFGWHWSTTFKFMNGADSGIPRVLGETYFILLRIDSVDGGDDTAYAWVNPSLATEPAIGTADAVQTRSMQVGNGAIIHNKNNAGQGQNENIWDEYRMGETFADVTPYIPEPAFGVIALLGALALRLRK